MRILLYGNAPTTKTGYGTQFALFAPMLKAAGHEVAVAANFGIEGTNVMWGPDIPVFPRGHDVHSNDIVGGHAAAWNADWVLTLYDVWPLNPAAWANLRVASWVPVDHAPAPEPVAAWCRDHLTIAMSRFGQRELQAAGVDAMYAPHGVDLELYRPTPALPDGRTFREAAGIPADAFLVAIVNANNGITPPRKAWGENLQAAAELMRRHRDAWLYVHSVVNGQNRVNLARAAALAGIPPDRIVWGDQYRQITGDYQTVEMAAIYSAADVLLATSYGEGFGLTALESAACGTPVVVSDWTASREVGGEPAWRTPVQKWLDPFQESWFGVPLVEPIVAALEEAYAEKGSPAAAARSAAAMAHAATYEVNHVFETCWRPVLARLERELAASKAPARPPVNTAIRPNKKRRKAA